VKRGAGKVFTMDFQSAELAWQIEPVHEQTAERIFERHWAIAVLESAFAELALRYSEAGKSYLFDALSRCLTTSHDAPRYQDLASDLGLSIDAIKKAVARLRSQYAKIVRQEVAKTISDAENLEDEIHNLFQALQC
jgi:RNA polymerase sigma-70 factor (ECF subfamily)